MTSYIKKTSLTEKQIESDVAAYLAWCAIGTPFRLLDVNEQLTGADRLCDAVMPVYLQFKKSQGLDPLPNIVLKSRSNESALQEIRRFRKRNDLADNPTLYFQLRKKAEKATDFQHNVLLANHKPPNSYAVYVAPLSLDKDEYFKYLIGGPSFDYHPWRFEGSKLWDEWNNHARLRHFHLQPFLRNHISIPPHERVDTHEHHYAYSMSGDEVSWHSPAIIDGGPFRLSDFMTDRTREFLSVENSLPTAEQGVANAITVIGELGISPETIISGDSALEQLRSYGVWLRKTYDIRQILLSANLKTLQLLRSSGDR